MSELVLGQANVAVQELEDLTTRSPANAKVWSDLAAARYELARADDDARGFASALAAGATAVETDSSLPEAHFNYALAAEALGLDSVAVEGFRHYLAVEPGAAWSDEARSRLSKLQTMTVGDRWTRMQSRLETERDPVAVERIAIGFPQQTRTWAEGEYLARWATAYENDCDEEAARWLSLSRNIGRALRARSGESLLYQAVAAIDRASPAGRMQLAKAHLIYRRGGMIASARDSARALPLLNDAEHAFAATSSPMSLMARFYRVNAHIDRQENRDASKALAPLLKAPDAYFALRAHALFDQSLLAARAGHLFEALDAGRDAEAIFARLGEVEFDARALTSLARILNLLGKPEAAWQLHRRAFKTVSASGSSLALAHALRAAARDELQEGHPATARTLFDIELTLPALPPRLAVDTLLQRLKANGDRGDLDVVRKTATAIPDPQVREEALDDVSVAAARQSAPPQAIAMLSQSIAFRTRVGDELVLASLLVDRARLFRKVDRPPEAEADLTSAMALVERQRAAIVSDDLRDTFIDTARAAMDELFDLYASQNRYAAAFDLVERTRGQGLTERLHSADEPLPSAQLAARLSSRTVVAQFTRWRDAVVILALTHSGLTAHVSSCAAFDRKSAELNDAIEKRDGLRTESLSTELMDVLVAPLSAERRGSDTLVIISDEHTAGIPFAGLRDRSTRRYLVEDVTLVMAPSASSYLASLKVSRRSSMSNALLVGNPAFDTRRLSDLTSLPSASEEVSAMRSLYARATVLTRERATRQAVLHEIEASDLIHIAAHAVVNRRDPSLSLIALAPDADNSGSLYLRDIAALHLTRAPVVVLAGCRTASRTMGYGSLRSLSSAFLAAGSRATVGSLWDIDDDATRVFSTKLHQGLAAGAAPADAVRDAQLAMLHSTVREQRDPSAWSGFQVYLAQ